MRRITPHLGPSTSWIALESDSVLLTDCPPSNARLRPGSDGAKLMEDVSWHRRRSAVLTNADLEKMVDTSDEWITTRTGIKERRIASPEETTSFLATSAAEKALEDAGLPPENIQLIIMATFTGDVIMPATACLIQKNIGASHAAAFDLSAACTGFLYGLSVAKQFIISGAYDTVLVVAAEKLSCVTDWTDRDTCVLFGDGAGAAVVSSAGRGPRIIGEHLASDGSIYELLILPGGGCLHPASHETVDQKLHFLKMSGREVFKHAVTSMVKSASKLIEQHNLTAEDIRLLVPHQANKRIITEVGRHLGIPEERIHINIEKYGNMSAATTSVGMDEAFRSNRFNPGDKILLVAFGGGFTWGSILLEW
jgi:3-oxoacyl-[acyl-carrier-protein] synthase-3